MAITTADGIVAAAKQQIKIQKASVVSVAATYESIFQAAGTPGAGSLAVGNTTAGVIVDDTVAGFPPVNSFGGGATGYIAAIDFSCSVSGRFALKDRIYAVGSISCTVLATTTLASQPVATGRMPDAAGVGCEIWVEIGATAVSATATTVTVTYTNSAGVTGRSTGAQSINGFAIGRLLQMPLQAGDAGVQKIETVVIGGTVATTGVLNVIIARPLWEGGRVGVANAGDVHGWDKTLLPIVYDTSALWLIYAADSTATGIVDCLITVING